MNSFYILILEGCFPGCFFSFLKLSSAVCCAVKVKPISDKKYRAVNLRIPNVIAQFQTKYIDENGTVLDTRNYNVDLNSGMFMDILRFQALQLVNSRDKKYIYNAYLCIWKTFFYV